MTNFRNSPMWGIVVLVLLLATSLLLRHQHFEKVTGADGLDAPYHVLLTVTALNESEVHNHWFLPTVSLGKEQDKNIPWGANVPTKTGDYIYTSFTPPGFLAPYFWFKALGLDPSLKNLAYFNSFLGGVGTLTLFMLLLNLLRLNGDRGWLPVAGALVASTIAIFSREALLSQGIIYWSQCLFQLILISSIYFLFKYLTSQNRKKIYGVALVALTFLGPLTEWTGYIFNTGLILLFWLDKKNDSRHIALSIIIATIAAGITTLVHYGLVVGFEQAIRAFSLRFFDRSAARGTIFGLLRGYALSYGFYLIVLFTILALNRFKPLGQQATGNRQNSIQVIQFIFIASCIPLLENFLLLQHATQFSFDRLKFIIPASLILGLAFVKFGTKGRVIFLIFILVSSVQGWKSYKNDLQRFSEWAAIDSANRYFIAKIIKEYGAECSVYSSNLSVRGYANLLFHRGIYEIESAQNAQNLIKLRNACNNIHIQGAYAFTFSALPKYTGATVTSPDGNVKTIINKNTK